MKSQLKLISTFALALAAIVARAATETVDGVTWSYTVSGNQATVTGASPCVGEMTVPDMLGECPVTAIEYKAFLQKNEISKMTLPATVKSIGSYAFYSCSALTDINFPEGLMTIGYEAFYNCSALQSIALPDSVTALGDDVFCGCSAATTLRLSAKLTTVPSYAFRYCSALTKIAIPESVTSIGNNAFGYCSSATTLTLPEGLTTIGSSAFYWCSALTALKIPSTVTSVAENAFQATPALKSISVAEGCTCVKVTDGCLVSASGTALMAAPSGNAALTIPEGVVSISENMFNGASNLKIVTLPSTLLTMGRYAFFACSSLGKIVFPASFASFSGDCHFRNCSSLMEVVFNGPPPANIGNSWILNYGTLAYPREYGAAWQKVVALNKFNGYKRANVPEVEYVTVAVRANDPTILDVVYRVKSAKATVKVRALAFKDGVRSFANVVRPTEFIEGTAANIGDAIAANVEHKLSWRVSADWKVDLAKCKFEVLAVEDDLLPLELRTIPANGANKAMEISWNAITESQVFDALLWLYADGDKGLTLTNGVLKNGSTQLASGGGLSTGNAVSFVYSKMSYGVLSGANLTYANGATRLGLSPSGVRQYAYRWIEAQ